MIQGAVMTLIETIIFTVSDYRISNYNFNFSLSLSSSRGETKKLQDSMLSNTNVRAVTAPDPWNSRSNSQGVLRVK